MTEIESTSERNLRIKIINLQRLLNCMQADRLKELASQRNSREIISNMQYAQTLLREIENSMQATTSWRGYGDKSLVILNGLVEDFDKMCHIANTLVQNIADAQEPDLIDQIFFSPESDDEVEDNPITNDEDFDEFEFDEICGNSDNESITSNDVSNANKILDSHAQNSQKEMQQVLEEEIAEMASRLKESSLAMNQSLKEQNQNMDNMMDLAVDLETRVTDVTNTVEERNKSRGWMKTFGTWTLALIIASSFICMLMMMKTFPKRSNSCILFCDSKSRISHEAVSKTDVQGTLKIIVGKCESINGKRPEACYSSKSEGVNILSDDDPETNLGKLGKINGIKINNNQIIEDENLESFSCVDGECYARDNNNYNENGREKRNKEYNVEDIYLELKNAIFEKNTGKWRDLIAFSSEVIHIQDENGWLLQHECARAGLMEELVILHEHGADLRKRTAFGQGSTALELAINFLYNDHPLIGYLHKHSAS